MGSKDLWPLVPWSACKNTCLTAAIRYILELIYPLVGDRGDTIRPRQLADEEARPVRRGERLRGGQGEETEEN